MDPRRFRRKDHDRHSRIRTAPRGRKRLSCSSGMISGRDAPSPAEFLLVSFSSLTETTSELFSNSGSTVGRRTNTGTRQERTSSSPRIRLQLLFDFDRLFRPLFVQLLASGSKFLFYTILDL